VLRLGLETAQPSQDNKSRLHARIGLEAIIDFLEQTLDQ